MTERMKATPVLPAELVSDSEHALNDLIKIEKPTSDRTGIVELVSDSEEGDTRVVKV